MGDQAKIPSEDVLGVSFVRVSLRWFVFGKPAGHCFASYVLPFVQVKLSNGLTDTLIKTVTGAALGTVFSLILFK